MADYVPFISISGFILVFALVLALMNWLSGWSALARKYRSKTHPPDTRWWFLSATLGRVSYRNSLIVGSDTSGLHLSLIAPFRLGHPALLIPWEQVSVTMNKKSFFGLIEIFEFHFEGVPQSVLRMSKYWGQKILRASAGVQLPKSE